MCKIHLSKSFIIPKSICFFWDFYRFGLNKSNFCRSTKCWHHSLSLQPLRKTWKNCKLSHRKVMMASPVSHFRPSPSHALHRKLWFRSNYPLRTLSECSSSETAELLILPKAKRNRGLNLMSRILIDSDAPWDLLSFNFLLLRLETQFTVQSFSTHSDIRILFYFC